MIYFNISVFASNALFTKKTIEQIDVIDKKQYFLSPPLS